jgi:hypothetical protein
VIIRDRQMASLSQANIQRFEDRVAEHLNRSFPANCKILGPSGVEEIIRYGIRRAASHGINLERDVCKYIDVMFAFGRDFDRDPHLPWACRILTDEDFTNSTARMERLFEEAKMHKTAQAGSGSQ